MTDPRVIVSRPAGPDGPAVLAVYGDGPRPLVTVPLTPRRVLRLAGELLAAVEPGEIGPGTPADAPPSVPHPDGAKDGDANPEPSHGGSRAIGSATPDPQAQAVRRHLRLYLPALHAAAHHDATGTAFYPASVLAEMLGFTEADARGALDTVAEDLEAQGDDVPFPAGLLWRCH